MPEEPFLLSFSASFCRTHFIDNAKMVEIAYDAFHCPLNQYHNAKHEIEYA